MADIRKEQERDELHRSIWAIADELRGSVDGWDFKSYVLGMMFYRYISENLTNYINEGEAEAGEAGFDYAQLSDEEAEQAREDLVKTKGFFILPSELFCNVRKRAAGDENLNMTLEAVFNHIEESAKGSESEDNFSGLFDDIDVNSNKLGEESIGKIVGSFASRKDVDYFARCVPYDEIAGNDYNLSVYTYVEAEDTREKIDIVKLNGEVREIVARQQTLRDEIDRIIAEIEAG